MKRILATISLTLAISCSFQVTEPTIAPFLSDPKVRNFKRYSYPISLVSKMDYNFSIPSLLEGIAYISIKVTGALETVRISESVYVDLQVINDNDRVILQSLSRLGAKPPALGLIDDDWVAEYIRLCPYSYVASSDIEIQHDEGSLYTRHLPPTRIFSSTVPKCPDCRCRWEWRTRKDALYRAILSVKDGHASLSQCKAELVVSFYEEP